jgi:hypothetical protein
MRTSVFRGANLRQETIQTLKALKTIRKRAKRKVENV